MFYFISFYSNKIFHYLKCGLIGHFYIISLMGGSPFLLLIMQVRFVRFISNNTVIPKEISSRLIPVFFPNLYISCYFSNIYFLSKGIMTIVIPSYYLSVSYGYKP